MKRYYGDYTIVVNKIESPIYGKGFRAEFYVSKINSGLKEYVRIFESYAPRMTANAVIEQVKRIIEMK